jgi:hypothetical protein
MKAKILFTGPMLFLTFTILLFMGLSGCSESPTDNSGTQGDIRLYIVDSPGDYDAVNIVVTEVSVHLSSGDTVSGWTVISDSLRTINLLYLTNGNFDILGTRRLHVGRYSQIRLKIGTGSNVVVDGVTHSLEIPSGSQTGLKLNHQFDIEADALYELTLDFDASRSIHVTGNGQYKMMPVIRVAANYTSGCISGVVSPPNAYALVSSMVNSDSISSFANVINGGFKFMALPTGIYSVTINSGVNAYCDTTITGITVVARQDTNIGTIVLRQI